MPARLTAAERDALQIHLAWFCDPYESKEFASAELHTILAKLTKLSQYREAQRKAARKAKKA